MNGDGSLPSSILFVGSLVESEYINTLQVYFTYCLLGKQSISLSKCCCVAENRKDGACKHRAALLFSLSIIQGCHFLQAPKDFRPSTRTLLNLKGESNEKLEKFRIWPWMKTISLMFEPWPPSMKKKFVLQPLPPPHKGRKKNESEKPLIYSDISCLPQITQALLSTLLLPPTASHQLPAPIQHENEGIEISEVSSPVVVPPSLPLSPVAEIIPSELPPSLVEKNVAHELHSAPQKRRFSGPPRNSESAYHVSKRGRLCFSKKME